MISSAILFLTSHSGYFRRARLAPRAPVKEPWQLLGRKQWGLASGRGCGGSTDGFGRGLGGNKIGLAGESDVRMETQGIRIALGQGARMTGVCHFWEEGH